MLKHIDVSISHAQPPTQVMQKMQAFKKFNLGLYSDSRNGDLVVESRFELCLHVLMIIVRNSICLVLLLPQFYFLFSLIKTSPPLVSPFFPSFYFSCHQRCLPDLRLFPPALCVSLFVSLGHSSECGPSSLAGRDWGITKAVDRKSATATPFPALR